MEQLESEEVPPSFISPEDIEKEGWLFKESRFWKTWRKRWWVLTKKWLITFENEDWRNESKPTEQLYMGKWKTVKSIDDEVNKNNAFKVDIEGTVFRFYTDTYADKEAWIGALGRAMIKKSVIIADEQFDNLPDFL